jgi:DNA-binding NarL/FixJ family response regulator
VKPTRVVIADDHVLVRGGIRTLLERMENVQVVAEASHGREALDLVATHDPDLVILDLSMPEVNGLEAADRMKRLYPHVKVVMLSMHDHDGYVLRAFESGAAGYVLKDAAVAELEGAIEAVMDGKTYLSSRIPRSVLENARSAANSAPGIQALTPREREIAKLVAEGRSTKEIAALLDLSVKTVDAHRGAMMHKLGVSDIPGLVRCAMREGLVPPEI